MQKKIKCSYCGVTYLIPKIKKGDVAMCPKDGKILVVTSESDFIPELMDDYSFKVKK